ncbi:MFS transporter [Nostoc sp. CHAB 5715]|nr:MFS transporter [Nostoc sp. CHAB 5836]MCC5621569.1 MFS transporter [Nostoc sp. CHAB 5715]
MRPHHRIFGVFFIFALSMGAMLSRLPDLQRQFDLTEGQLGLTLIAMSCGALVGLTFSGPLIARYPARTGVFVTIFVASALYALVPIMPSVFLIIPLLFLAGICAGAVEIIVNLEADRLEAQLGYGIMSRTHGMWSLGFFVTALFSAGLRQAGVPVSIHLAVALLVVVISGLFVFRGIENAPPRPDSHAGETPRIAFPTIGLAALCLIGAAPLLAEGAGIDWSAIYMRDVFNVEPFIGGLSVTVFSLFMAIARLSMDGVVDRLSPRTVAASLLLIAIAGLVLVATAPHEYVALLGFALTGIGCSAVYPLAVSAAAQRTDRPASVNVASLGQMTFVVFFLAPPLLGLVAEEFGIRMSYWVVVPLLVAVLLVIQALPGKAKLVGAHG